MYLSSACRGVTEGLGAGGAGADGAEMVVAVDAGGVAVGEGDLNGVIADSGSLLCARLGFEHRQRGGGSGARAGKSAFSMRSSRSSCICGVRRSEFVPSTESSLRNSPI